MIKSRSRGCLALRARHIAQMAWTASRRPSRPGDRREHLDVALPGLDTSREEDVAPGAWVECAGRHTRPPREGDLITSPLSAPLYAQGGVLSLAKAPWGCTPSGPSDAWPPSRLSQSPDAFRPSWPEFCARGGVRDGSRKALAPSSCCASQSAAPANAQARGGESVRGLPGRRA